MANDSGKRKRVPPSRKRYEQTHPTISVRVDVETFEELQELKRVSGISVADLVRVGLEKCSPLSGTASNEGRLSAFSMAYEAVCDECGDLILRLAGEHLPADSPPGRTEGSLG